MKICFLAPANNYHTKKWCKWFADHDHEVHVVSFVEDDIANAIVHFIDTGTSVDANDSRKLKYLLKARTVKRIVDKIDPDIVNAHYATSYGTVAALSGIKNYALSLWGTDVYEFPNKGVFHKYLLKFSLFGAKYIFSTSNAMAEETGKYTKKDIYITPFGVDMKLFNPKKRNRSDEEFIIGTIKKLEPVYGIEYILKAVELIIKRRPDIRLKVRIAGNGTHEHYYKKMAEDLGVSSIISWLGFIPQSQAAVEWANMDVAVIPSIQESFGVSAIEAQASGVPVIISNVSGLKETTRPEETSIVVNVGASEEIANSIIYLYDNKKKLRMMGNMGRHFVEKEYDLDKCFNYILSLYTDMILENNSKEKKV